MAYSTYLTYFYYHLKDDNYNTPMNLSRKEYVVYIQWSSDDLLNSNKNPNINPNINPYIKPHNTYKDVVDKLISVFEANSEFEITRSRSALGQTISNDIRTIGLNHLDLVITVLGDENRIMKSYNKTANIVEWGPKYNMETPWSSNLKSVYSNMGINLIRAEQYTRQYINCGKSINFDPITQQNVLFLESLYNDIVNGKKKEPDGLQIIPLEDISNMNSKFHLALDNTDIEWITNLVKKIGRDLTKAELYDIAQSNSEHSRHWVFNSKLILEDSNEPITDTLFSLVKAPYKKLVNNPNNVSLVAFSDDASAIKGIYDINPTLTAETHNFPTGIAPFEGASTGVGGRIRDTIAIGKGGDIVASLAGYCVEDLYDNKTLDELNQEYNLPLHSGRQILTEASNGASDYGNKVGEPIIGGFVRTFTGYVYTDEYKRLYSFRKPIMFTAGIGHVNTKNLVAEVINMEETNEQIGIFQVGGPAYPIGMGGGSSSSVGQTNIDYSNAVQRGDPEMASRVIVFLRELQKHSIILSIHDQGAGGCGNVVKEIVDDANAGGIVDLSNILLGDKTMSPLQIWCSEYQEQLTFLAYTKDIYRILNIGKKEAINVYQLGLLTNDKKIKVLDSSISGSHLVNLPLKALFEGIPQKELLLRKRKFENDETFDASKYDLSSLKFANVLQSILETPTVGCKSYLTNKVDRSVSGLVVQQQCVGPYQLPLSNYSIVADILSPTSYSGTITAIGEGSITAFINSDNGYSNLAERVIVEMLTNMSGCQLELSGIRGSANWMWSPKNDKYEAYAMYQAMETLSSMCIDFGFAIDGGKDSVSMYASMDKKSSSDINITEKELAFSPPTLVLTGYYHTLDHRKRVQPYLKSTINSTKSVLYYIPFIGETSLAGTMFAHIMGEDGSIPSRTKHIIDASRTKKSFEGVQMLHRESGKNSILALHDVSDGGLITTLLEMAFTGTNVSVDINCVELRETVVEFLFSERCGVVVQVENDLDKSLYDMFGYEPIKVGEVNSGISDNGIITINSINNNISSVYFRGELAILKRQWKYSSDYMETFQMKFENLKEEMENNYIHKESDYIYSSIQNNNQSHNHNQDISVNALTNDRIKVLILRETGSNGQREMHSAFLQAGFDTDDMTLTEIINKIDFSLDGYNGIVFVGGFSNGDVPSAGVGWAMSMLSNPVLSKEFAKFKDRKDTFSLGVCNGCQVMSYLGWIDTEFSLQRNVSNKFESRWSVMSVLDTPINRKSVFYRDLVGASWAIWVAHGEGRFVFPEHSSVHISSQYGNDINKSMEYPNNPNGSMLGTASVSSSDGRHMAIMPHPERSFVKWQMPYCPVECSDYTPWFEIFRSAFKWVLENK